jgi:hypothetical protein
MFTMVAAYDNAIHAECRRSYSGLTPIGVQANVH